MRRFAVLMMTLLMFLPVPGRCEEDARPTLQVHQVMNRQADAYLLRVGETAVMIDGGNANGESGNELMDYLAQSGITRLTAYIVTHYHNDHACNLNRILECYGDSETLVYGPTERLPVQLLPVAAGEYRQMADGDRVELGPLRVQCVAPARLTDAGQVNADSLNVLITYGKRRFLFTGDCVSDEAVLRRHRAMLADVDVLKFPHHGLRPFAISEEAFRQLRPSVILIPGDRAADVRRSAQDNRVTASVFSNEDGHVVILTDGEALTVIPQAKPGQFALR